MNESRRDFFKYVSALSCAAGLIEAAETRLSGKFPTKPMDRLAVTSYPFRALIISTNNRGRDNAKPGMDVKEFPAMVAREFGIHNINPLADHFASTDPGYIETLRTAIEEAKSHIVDLGLSSGRFYDPDESERTHGIDYGRKGIDIAVQIGSPSVRQHIAGRQGVKPDAALAADSLGQLAEYGAKRNIVVNLENDSPGSEDPFFILEIIRKVDSPYLRALPDFGNSLRAYSPEENERALTELFKCAYNMSHVKHLVPARDGQERTVDVGKIFAIAKADSYKGYFSMETSNPDPYAGTRELVQLSLKYLK
jgi:sugar phosphate isomerase/epimerase